jgi:hypothetical protein
MRRNRSFIATSIASRPMKAKTIQMSSNQGCAGVKPTLLWVSCVLARRQTGHPIEKFDALIAAMRWRPAPALATHDAGGFAGCGLTVISTDR